MKEVILDIRTKFLIITYVWTFYIWLINLYDLQISSSLIGTGHNIMTEQWFVYMKQRFLCITSDNFVFNEKHFLCDLKWNCVISTQLRPFSRHKSGKWTGMYLCVRGIVDRHVFVLEVSWTGMYLCVRGINFASFCDFSVGFCFSFYQQIFSSSSWPVVCVLFKWQIKY
jgi:hypothetical protein